jgi:hypothetical protein
MIECVQYQAIDESLQLFKRTHAVVELGSRGAGAIGGVGAGGCTAWGCAAAEHQSQICMNDSKTLVHSPGGAWGWCGTTSVCG